MMEMNSSIDLSTLLSENEALKTQVYY